MYVLIIKPQVTYLTNKGLYNIIKRSELALQKSLSKIVFSYNFRLRGNKHSCYICKS